MELSASVYKAWIYSQFSSLVHVISKPDSLLLEAGGGQTTSEGHNQTSALLLFFYLESVDKRD